LGDYGSDDDGGFNAISRAYKRDPTIDHYLRLRRENPDGEIEVAVIGGMEQLFYLEPELRKYGFEPELVASVMDADPEAISELALLIIQKLIEAKQLSKSGETHLVRRGLAVPDKLVNWLVTCMLDALSWNDNLHIPRDLIVLIRERLGGSNPEYEQGSRAHEMRWHAIIVGAQLKAQGIEPSFRMLAKVFNVAPSTVMRWFPNDDFQKEVEAWSKTFDEDGKPRPLSDLRGPSLHTK